MKESSVSLSESALYDEKANRQSNNNIKLRESSLRTSNGGGVSISDFASSPENNSENALLIKVLRGMRKSPISQQDFQEYLDNERSGELSRFFRDAEKHETIAGEKAVQAIPLAFEISDHYIKLNAEEEINISETDRKRILKRLEDNGEEAGFDPTLFKGAKAEVIKMLSGEKFQRFLKKQMETNITSAEANRRLTAGILLFCLAFIICGVLMWLQTFAQYPLNVRWWRLIVFPLLFWACGLVFSYQAKVCTGLASKCVRMREGQSWFSAFQLRASDNVQYVSDEMALLRIARIAAAMNRKIFICTFLLQTLLLVLPPGYGILVQDAR